MAGLELEYLDRLFPVLSIERFDLDVGFFRFEVVQAADVDAVLVGRGAGVPECMYAAMFAEPVLGDLQTELVQRERILAGEQSEVPRWHTKIQRSLFGADGAVALCHFGQVDIRFEPDPTAVTPTFVRPHDLFRVELTLRQPAHRAPELNTGLDTISLRGHGCASEAGERLAQVGDDGTLWYPVSFAKVVGVIVAKPNLGSRILPHQCFEWKIDAHSLRALHEGCAALRVAEDDDLGWPQRLAYLCCTRSVIYPRKHVQPTLLDQILESIHGFLRTVRALQDN
jgi:hypothetical protein